MEKDKYHMISLVCGNLKNDTNELSDKTDSKTQKTNLWLPQGKQKGGINQEFGIKICTILYEEQITKTYCIAQRTTSNYLVITYDGKESEK